MLWKREKIIFSVSYIEKRFQDCDNDGENGFFK